MPKWKISDFDSTMVELSITPREEGREGGAEERRKGGEAGIFQVFSFSL